MIIEDSIFLIINRDQLKNEIILKIYFNKIIIMNF
jgi:hypothetical protein